MNKKINDELVISIIKKLVKKKIKISSAAVVLGITERQVYRLRKLYLANGLKKEERIKCVPKNKTDKKLEEKIVNLYKNKYKGFSYTHFCEKLKANENIDINLKTLSRILFRYKIISPYVTKATKQKLKKILISSNCLTTNEPTQNLLNVDNIIFDQKEIHNRYRHITDFGALIQLDARFDYYIDKEKWALHLAIDVASGQFVGAYFDKQETLNGYYHVLYQIISNYGLPKCILTDNRTVFEYIKKNSTAESKNTLIQFKYACISFGIKLNTTSVATYKSIIERGNGTFGRRVPQELQIKKIKNIDQANLFLINYLDEINHKFSHSYLGKNVFRASPEEEVIFNHLGTITRRKFDNGCTVRYMNNYYYATVHNKIVCFNNKTNCLIVNTYDKRLIIVVESIPYVAININDFEIDEKKQENPEAFSFISEHKVNHLELINYRKKHISKWNYNAYNKFVENELSYLENKF